MREGRIVRPKGGGGHGDSVTRPKEVCERDTEWMNMISRDKAR